MSIDESRIVCPLFQKEYGGYIPTSAMQLHFSKCHEDRFKTLNSAWHSRLPKIGNSHFRVCYCAEYGNAVYAVAAWSNPVARLLPQREWIELRRFAISPDSPRFTASRMLGWMRKDIKHRFPDVIRLISYQDLDVHAGTIYKASGWKQAENYKPRARGWIGWGTRPRVGRTNQNVAPRMRWEFDLRVRGKAIQMKVKDDALP
jgi:hypothetical protein